MPIYIYIHTHTHVSIIFTLASNLDKCAMQFKINAKLLFEISLNILLCAK